MRLIGGQAPRRAGLGAGVLLGAAGALVAGTALLGVAGFAGPAGASGSSQYSSLKKDLLVHSDFPSGWSKQGGVTTSNGGGGGFPGQSQLATCVGVSPSLFNVKSPTATSPTFSDKAGEHYVQDSANTFSSTKVANEEEAAVSNIKVPGCLTADMSSPSVKQELSSQMKGATVGAVTVSAANPAGLVPHSSGFTISFPATYQGVSVNVGVTIVTLVRGKTGVQLSFTAVGLPFSTSLEHHLVGAASSRS